MLHLFKDIVRQVPNKTAIVFCDVCVSYKELDQWTDQIAAQIRGCLSASGTENVNKDLLEAFPFVGVYSERSLATIPMMIGIWKAGFAYVPLDRKNNADRLNFIVSDAHLQLVLTDCGIPEGVDSHVRWKHIERTFLNQKLNPTIESTEETIGANDVQMQGKYAYVIYTSGTTGLPKGTPITHFSLRHMVEVRQDLIPVTDNKMEMSLASIGFDASVWGIFPALMTGTSVYFPSEAEKSRPELIVDVIERLAITTVDLTPAYLALLPYRSLPSLKYLITGGEACPLGLIRLWQQTCAVINAYGPTENTVTTSACIFTSESQPNDIGKPMRGVICYVLDEQLRPVTEGEKGELYVGGPQLSEGYLNREQLTAEKFIPNPFASECPSAPILYATGDVVSRQSNGHLLFFGRKDTQVKIHGIRVELDEVKLSLESCQYVEAAAVEVFRNDSHAYLLAYIKMHEGYSMADDSQTLVALKTEVAKRLPSYMIPAQFVLVSNIPENINGKTDFNALHQFLPQQQEDDILKGGEEQVLASLWHQVLGRPVSIKSDSHFLELGGDSLSVISLLLHINERYHLSLSLADIQDRLILHDLAVYISEAVSASSTFDKSVPLTKRSGNCVPLSMHLKNLFVHCLLSEQASIAYNLVDLIPFGSSVDEQRLLTAWNQLLAAQDALRMTFHQGENGKYYLEVHACSPLQHIETVYLNHFEELKQHVESQLAIPFNLTEGPLYCLKLYHHPQTGWLLGLFIHHLITDGWSSGILRRQLYALYRSEQLKITASYADYVYSFSKQEKTPLRKQSADYWSVYVQDTPKLHLPGFVTQNGNDDNFSAQCFTSGLSQDLFQRIRQYCALHHITPFSLLSSALMLMLYRISRQANFIIAYPVSGREQPEYADTMGYFVRPCPLKFRESLLDVPFYDYCQQVMDDVQTAIQHPYVTMRLPLVSFTFESTMQASRLDIQPAYTMAPLTLTVDADDDGMLCRWIYRTSVSDSSKISRLNDCYQALLANIVTSDKPARHLSMTSPAELELIRQRNTIAPLCQSGLTVIDLFNQQVEQHPDHLALKDDTGTYTYHELKVASNALATQLLEVGARQEAIGLFMPRSNKALVAMLAIIKAGCYYVPLDQTYPADRIQAIVDDCEMRFMVKEEGIVTLAESRVNAIPWEEEGTAECQASSLPVVTPDSPLYMIYTSGTTGKPKGVVISHANLVSMITIGAEAAYRSTVHDRVLQFNTYLFDASVLDIFSSLLSGATLITASNELKQSPEQLFAMIEREQISWTAMPAAYLHMCNSPVPACLKTVLTGGESPSPSVIQHFSGIRLINSYGPTENTVAATCHLFADSSDEAPNCIGKPLPGVTCYVLDDDHNLLPDGVSGELYIGGLQLSSGYYRLPALNETSFIENPFVTETDRSLHQNLRLYASGDRVCISPAGNIYFQGRMDHQVKISGYRIELSDIESTLLTHPQVDHCIVDLRQKNNVQQLSAFIETSDSQLSPKQLRTYLADKLPTYMIPAYWAIIPKFPLTANGKLDHSRLPEPVLYCAFNSSISTTEPTEDERRLRTVVARIMGAEAETIDVEADLKEELGMSSLHVLELSSQLSARGYRLTPADIYRQKTIKQIAAFCKAAAYIDMTPEQVNSRVCYFATPNDPHKPLLLVVSGYPYYEAYYTDFHHAFKDDYTILVLESPSEFYLLRPDFPMTMDALMAEYAEILRPILSQQPLAAITGLCIGGDMALRLAVELEAKGICRPIVFNIDGTANRSEYGTAIGFENQRGITPELNDIRNSIMHTLSSTFGQRFYDGEVYLFMATRFRDENASTREEAEANFPKNKRNWEKVQPDMPIIFIDDVHERLIHDPSTLQQIKSVIDQHLLV